MNRDPLLFLKHLGQVEEKLAEALQAIAEFSDSDDGKEIRQSTRLESPERLLVTVGQVELEVRSLAYFDEEDRKIGLLAYRVGEEKEGRLLWTHVASYRVDYLGNVAKWGVDGGRWIARDGHFHRHFLEQHVPQMKRDLAARLRGE